MPSARGELAVCRWEAPQVPVVELPNEPLNVTAGVLVEVVSVYSRPW
jgi:hypothetical protein